VAFHKKGGGGRRPLYSEEGKGLLKGKKPNRKNRLIRRRNHRAGAGGGGVCMTTSFTRCVCCRQRVHRSAGGGCRGRLVRMLADVEALIHKRQNLLAFRDLGGKNQRDFGAEVERNGREYTRAGEIL